MADLYFMMKLWKPAYNYYYIAKKDFLSDEARDEYGMRRGISIFILACFSTLI